VVNGSRIWREARQDVILSAAKDLSGASRCFAALNMTFAARHNGQAALHLNCFHALYGRAKAGVSFALGVKEMGTWVMRKRGNGEIRLGRNLIGFSVFVDQIVWSYPVSPLIRLVAIS
jgi:hypothetical protein